MRLRFGFALLVFVSCGSPPSPENPGGASGGDKSKSDDGPVPSLRTGTIAIVDAKEPLSAKVTRSSIDAGIETVELAFQWPKTATTNNDMAYAPLSASAEGTSAFAFVGRREYSYAATDGSIKAWVRRPASAASSPVVLDVFVPSDDPTKGGTRFRGRAEDAKPTNDPAVFLDYLSALRTQVTSTGAGRRGAWQSFAYTRLGELIEAVKPPPPPPPPLQETPKTKPDPKATTKPGAKPPAKGTKPPATATQPPRPAPARPVAPAAARPPTSELAGLMDTTTGALGVQEALQADRPLFLAAAKEPPAIAIADLKGPKLAVHPWAAMTKRLKTQPPAEPLADDVPAENWYARASSFDVLTELLDDADSWATPGAHVLDRDPLDHGMSARYEAELGVARGPLTRALGSKVVTEVAVTGSDPHFKEGTDVTVIMRVKDHALFGAALSAAVNGHASAHGAITSSDITIAGQNVHLSRSADGVVRQHRAQLGDREFISNSPGGLARVLAAAQGKAPKLSAEPDFRYMLARDASVKSDVLAYMGDKLVAEVVGPKQKVAEARRQLALGELLTPGFAALLYGMMNGKSPASVDDLVAAHLFSKSELAHASSGEAITWKPFEAARSSWGTAAELTPLVNLPPVAMVTDAEKQGYERFANGYQNDWGTYIDPIAARLTRSKVGGETELTMELRELPLLDGSGYRDLQSEAGDTRFEVLPLDRGARAVVAIGEQSTLRKLMGEARGALGRADLSFDWIGDFAEIGVLDRASVPKVLRLLEPDSDVPEMPASTDKLKDKDALLALSQMPVYAEIAVKNPLGATVLLTALRSMATEAVPGMVTWGQAGSYRDIAIVKVSIDRDRAKREFQVDVDTSVYYTLSNGALMVSLNEDALHKLIDMRLDKKAPLPESDKTKGSQLSLEASSPPGGALWSAIAWVAEGELLRRSDGAARAMADALLRGAPERAKDQAAMRSLAFAYFGIAPLTVDGGAYSLAPEGLQDPVRGTLLAPSWPNLPVPGSPVEALMKVVSRARADLAFDDEGEDDDGKKMKSMHAKVTFRVR